MLALGVNAQFSGHLRHAIIVLSTKFKIRVISREGRSYYNIYTRRAYLTFWNGPSQSYNNNLCKEVDNFLTSLLLDLSKGIPCSFQR